jgi:hypothetical protein
MGATASATGGIGGDGGPGGNGGDADPQGSVGAGGFGSNIVGEGGVFFWWGSNGSGTGQAENGAAGDDGDPGSQ